MGAGRGCSGEEPPPTRGAWGQQRKEFARPDSSHASHQSAGEIFLSIAIVGIRQELTQKQSHPSLPGAVVHKRYSGSCSLAHWCLIDMRRWSGTSSCDLVNSPLCVGLRVWTSQPLCGYSSFFAYPLLCVPLTHSCLLNSGVLPDSVGEVLPYLPLQLLNHRPVSPDPLSCPVLPYLHYTVHKVPSISLCYFPELFS